MVKYGEFYMRLTENEQRDKAIKLAIAFAQFASWSYKTKNIQFYDYFKVATSPFKATSDKIKPPPQRGIVVFEFI